MRGGLGGGLGKCLADTFENALCVLEDLGVPEPQHSEAVSCQPIRAPLIPFSFISMLATVDFDYEPSLEASEIGYVRSHRNLTAEAAAFDLFSPQSEPEPYFSIGHLLAEPAPR